MPSKLATRPSTVRNPRCPLSHSTSTVGMMNELRVSVDLAMRGYEVFKALDAGASCDLVALKEGRCYRVQVKTARAYNLAVGGVKLNCDRSNPERFDLLAVVERATLAITYEPPLLSESAQEYAQAA